jgi:hypothetical protein
MLTIQPWNARVHDGVDLAALRGLAAGQVLKRANYVVPQGETWPEGHREDRAHEVDMAVELIMVSGAALVLSWAMDGIDEGLAIEFSGPDDVKSDLPGDAINVGGHADWEGLLGASIVDITPAWHIPNEGCPEMPWLYRFEFSDKSSLVVALGEVEGDGFTYSPDSLVVLFDRTLSVSYKIPASTTSAYG